jgi:hypothetical protein
VHLFFPYTFFWYIGSTHEKIWAFVWQEDIIPGFHLADPLWNRLGAMLTPIINGLANTITGYDRLSYSQDNEFQNSYRNIYPDSIRCNILQPHSKWHASSANALIDLLLLSSDGKHIIDGGTLVVEQKERDPIDSKNTSYYYRESSMENQSQREDSNDKFLSCAVRYGMSGFEPMMKSRTSDNNNNVDPMTIAMNDCVHYVFDYLTIKNNNTEMSHFSNCFISHYVSSSSSSMKTNVGAANTTEPTEESNLIRLVAPTNHNEITTNMIHETTMTTPTKLQKRQFLDQCLLEHGCIVFTSIFTIDVTKIASCTMMNHISNDVKDASSLTSCQTLVDEPNELDQCYRTCEWESNFICINECIMRNGKRNGKRNVSLSYQQMMSCLFLLNNPDHLNRSDFMKQCFLSKRSILFRRQQRQSTLLSSSVLIQGISTLTKCAIVGSCQNNYRRFLQTTRTIWQCSTQCYVRQQQQQQHYSNPNNRRRKNPFPFLKLPPGLSCWLGCYTMPWRQ